MVLLLAGTMSGLLFAFSPLAQGRQPGGAASAAEPVGLPDRLFPPPQGIPTADEGFGPLAVVLFGRPEKHAVLPGRYRLPVVGVSAATGEYGLLDLPGLSDEDSRWANEYEAVKDPFLRNGALLSPDGRWLAYAHREGEETRADLRIYDTVTAEATEYLLGDYTSYLYGLAWSPDSQRLTYLVKRQVTGIQCCTYRSVQEILEVSSGERLEVGSEPPSGENDWSPKNEWSPKGGEARGVPAWSPDATTLSLLTPDGIRLVSLPEGKQRLLPVELPLSHRRSHSWDPSGSRIAVLSSGTDPDGDYRPTLTLVDVQSGSARRTSLDALEAWAMSGWTDDTHVALQAVVRGKPVLAEVDVTDGSFTTLVDVPVEVVAWGSGPSFAAGLLRQPLRPADQPEAQNGSWQWWFSTVASSVGWVLLIALVGGALIVWRTRRGQPVHPAIWVLWFSTVACSVGWALLNTWQPVGTDPDPASSSFQQGYALADGRRQPHRVPAAMRRSFAESSALACAVGWETGKDIPDPRAPSDWYDYCAGLAQAQLDATLGRYHSTFDAEPFDVD